jgi:hypothetical protein
LMSILAVSDWSRVHGKGGVNNSSGNIGKCCDFLW